MERIAQREALVVGAVIMIFFGLLYPALLHARREARDGIRRDEIAAFKQLLEQQYNKHNTYPFEFNAAPHTYIVTEANEQGATAWYLRARLENSDSTHSDYNAEEGHNYQYRLIRESDATYYEVCGGTPTCGLDDPR